MSNFLSSLRSDLLDRRFLPILVILCAALVAALAYVAFGGSSSSTSSTASASAPGAASTGAPAGRAGAIAIVKAPETTTTKAVAETTSGAPHSSGAPRDPFKPLTGAKTVSTTSSSSTSGSSSSGHSASSSPASSSSSSPSSNSSSDGSTPARTPPAPKPSHPNTPAKPHSTVAYKVTLQFGVVPASPAEGAPPAPAQLQTYTDVPRGEALPSKSNPQLTFEGGSGTSAEFGLAGEAILHGVATCKPSPTQCQSILLAAGQSETFEVISSSGQATVYELKVVSVEKTSAAATTARAHTASRRNHHRRRRHGH